MQVNDKINTFSAIPEDNMSKIIQPDTAKLWRLHYEKAIT